MLQTTSTDHRSEPQAKQKKTKAFMIQETKSPEPQINNTHLSSDNTVLQHV